MENTVKIPCTCESAYQDAKYGKGIRVHNSTMREGTLKKELAAKITSARCTVCGVKKTL